MKHWEDAALLTDILDRHARLLVKETGDSDWAIFRHLELFLKFISDEPILRSFLEDYLDEAATISKRLVQGMTRAIGRATSLVEASPSPDQQLLATLVNARDQINDPKLAESALESLCIWAETQDSSDALGSSRSLRCGNKSRRLRQYHRAFAARFVQYSLTHPGAAYCALVEASQQLNYALLETHASVARWNAKTEQLHKLIAECELFGPRELDFPQPGVANIQRKVRTLHLALVTSLGRGRSRWAMVKRFAARCESLDRERLLRALNDAAGKAEAFLTLEFARYLFDAGYDPLVDATACGIRPDVLDVTSEPAIYVEAKQYENVGDATRGSLRKGLAQTLNTWNRLARRWYVPEAFLLVFRRSGRPLVFENSELRIAGGRLYVLCVDLAGASESGSRADVPVRVELRDLLRKEEGGAVDGDW